jgi:hypothetical protein
LNVLPDGRNGSLDVSICLISQQDVQGTPTAEMADRGRAVTASKVNITCGAEVD